MKKNCILGTAKLTVLLVFSTWIPYRKIYFDQTEDQSGPVDLELGVKYAFDKLEQQFENRS